MAATKRQLPYQISPLFRDFLLPLSERERKVLKTNILTDGLIRDPIVVWKETGILIDGHHRHGIYEELIAEGHKIHRPKIELRSFKSELEALRWMLDHQEGRRNQFTIAQRALAVVKNQELVERIRQQALERMKSGIKTNPSLKSDKGSTRRILAKFAGVSADSIDKALKIAEHPERDFLIGEIQNGVRLNAVLRLARMAKENALRNSRKPILLPPPSPISKGKVDVLHCTDVLAGLDLIQPGSVTASICSPPYALGAITYENPANDYSTYRQWLEFMTSVYRKQFDLLRTGGRVFINVDASNSSDRSELSRVHDVRMDLANALTKIGYHFYGEICWYKQHIIGDNCTNWGTFASPRRPNIGRNFEYILIYFKEMPVLEGDEADIDMTHDECRQFFPGQWYIKPEKRKMAGEEGYHPVPYPCELVYRLLKKFTYRGDVILDPFCGSGTTCYVAKALGRRFIGIDNSPSYIMYGRQRLAMLDDLSQTELEKAIQAFRFQVGLERSQSYIEDKRRSDGYLESEK